MARAVHQRPFLGPAPGLRGRGRARAAPALDRQPRRLRGRQARPPRLRGLLRTARPGGLPGTYARAIRAAPSGVAGVKYLAQRRVMVFPTTRRPARVLADPAGSAYAGPRHWTIAAWGRTAHDAAAHGGAGLRAAHAGAVCSGRWDPRRSSSDGRRPGGWRRQLLLVTSPHQNNFGRSRCGTPSRSPTPTTGSWA